ncbi:MAG: hypothetical protein Fur0022_45130 [Anaerolineales bacterium]
MNIEIIYNANIVPALPISLVASTTSGARAEFSRPGAGVLSLPAGPANRYRLAQWDNYHGLARARFPWRPPITVSLRARASHKRVPGTWGFGLWNDPMSLSLGFGSGRKLPALPNTAWFFFASPENHLSLRDDLPGHGALVGIFRSPNLPTWLLAPGVFALPLLALRPLARWLRRLTARIVRQDTVALSLDPTLWHTYAWRWETNRVIFWVDGQTVMETTLAPRGPLGLVIWVDNQFAAWRPDGSLQWGLLAGDGVQLNLEELSIQ